MVPTLRRGNRTGEENQKPDGLGRRAFLCLENEVEREGLPVNVFSVPKPHHEDAQCAVLNITNDPAIADPIAPESAKRAGQCLSGAARVVQRGDAPVHVIDNPAGRRLVEFPQQALCGVGVLNRPSQGLS